MQIFIKTGSLTFGCSECSCHVGIFLSTQQMLTIDHRECSYHVLHSTHKVEQQIFCASLSRLMVRPLSQQNNLVHQVKFLGHAHDTLRLGHMTSLNKQCLKIGSMPAQNILLFKRNACINITIHR